MRLMAWTMVEAAGFLVTEEKMKAAKIK